MVGSEIDIKPTSRYLIFTIFSPIFPVVSIRFSDRQINLDHRYKKSPEKAAARFLANYIEIRSISLHKFRTEV